MTFSLGLAETFCGRMDFQTKLARIVSKYRSGSTIDRCQIEAILLLLGYDEIGQKNARDSPPSRNRE